VREWRSSTWGEEISLEYGKALRGHAGARAPYRVFGANGPIGWTAQPLVQGPGVILGRKGAYRGIEYWPKPFFVIDTAYYVVPKGTLDMRWVYYAMKHYKLGELDDGSPIPSTTRAAVYVRDIAVPPLNEQRAIANILGALDDKIELNRRMNETLEAMARAIFKDWFVDFGPTRAKQAGRDPYLPPDLWSLFPDRLADWELAEIPEGWTPRSLDQIARFLNGLALQKHPAADGPGLPVIKIAQLRAGNSKGADQASADIPPDYMVRDGDILFSWSGSLECVLWAGGPGALNQHLFKVIPEDYPRWLCYLGVHQHLEDFRHIAAGKATTMGHIQRHHLAAAKLTLPPREVLRRMDALIEPLVEITWRRAVQSRILTGLRDLLLPKLISGEIRVRDAERIAEERAIMVGRSLAP
jgi:type I restriction enzyme S subunit